jgi:hypothetical protein
MKNWENNVEDNNGVKVNDVVLVKSSDEPYLQGCLAVVKEIYQWGVEADIPMPVKKERLSRSVALSWSEMRKIGTID